jgi:hypothetical protein
MERLLPSRGTSTSKRLNTSGSHRHRDEQITYGWFCGMPLALTNCMNQQTHMNNQFESNYALLVRSEEKGRGVLEAVLYVAFILSAVLLIWEFAVSPVRIEAVGLEQAVVSQAARTQAISRS